ncbi:MAG TPA: FliH/SctL family protein [Thermoleophilaceae bacterium]
MPSSDTLADGFVFEQLDASGMRMPAIPGGPATVAELADVRDLARNEGFEAGYAAGVEAARADIGVAASALATGLEEARQRLQADADLLEWQAVELALQLGDKVLTAALDVQPELVLEVIKGSLRRLVERDQVTVLVNPDDLDLVRGALDDVSASLGGIERLEAQGERRVGRGGAILRTPVGEIDARMETQLERAREVIVRELAAPELPVADEDGPIGSEPVAAPEAEAAAEAGDPQQPAA